MTAAGVRRRSDRFASEGTRFTTAALVAVVVSIPVPYLATGSPVRSVPEFLTAFAIGGMTGLDVMCITYISLTVWAFARVPGAELPELIRAQPVARWVRVLRGGDDGPYSAVQFAVLALVGATVLPRIEELVPAGRPRAVLVVLAVAGVVLCWVMLTLSYTVHYARVRSSDGGLRFPGATEPTFGDYVYFAVAVGTTFGTTDVEVDGRRMRRVVTAHALLAFVFNTVIIALLISVLTAT